MPKILFASNSISHFPGSVISGDAWAYSASRVPYAIGTPANTICASPEFDATDTDETWVHLRYGATAQAFAFDRIFEVVDINGDPIAAVAYSVQNGNYRLTTTINGQTATDSRAVPFLGSQARTFDLQIRCTTILAEVRLYINEILICVTSFAISGHEKPRRLWIGGMVGIEQRYSEIIIANGDTRNSRLDILRPIAVGTYNTWEGLVATLSDDDPTTGMTTTLPNQNQSTVLSAYTGAANISNVVQMTQTVRGINAPEHLKHLIRISTIDYLTADFDIPIGKDYQLTDWSLNPATSLPWVAANLVGAEFGFRSVA